ncbi:MAG: molybdopterin-dependent oxidoreductase [Actinobacteria bacterium]|nr:molybdopterin-dependent oxidoreductase [Actinomycetota bacterium]
MSAESLQEAEVGTPIGRRVVLGMAAVGAAGVLFGSRVQDWLGNTLAPITARDGTGLSSLLPVGRFRIYSVTGSLPSKLAADYHLQVDGLVDKPFTLTFDELTAMPATGLTADFQCVTGWRVHEVPWVGVKLRDLLDRAGVKHRAAGVTFQSFDGLYTESLSMDQARRDDVLVVYRMERKPVSRNHGGPVRLYVAPMYGYKSCKWLERITVTSKVVPGYWEVRGYDQDAWIGKSNGREDAPV